jgi:hypothetical protein
MIHFFETIFIATLARDSGRTITTIVTDFPAISIELRPLLSYCKAPVYNHRNRIATASSQFERTQSSVMDATIKSHLRSAVFGYIQKHHGATEKGRRVLCMELLKTFRAAYGGKVDLETYSTKEASMIAAAVVDFKVAISSEAIKVSLAMQEPNGVQHYGFLYKVAGVTNEVVVIGGDWGLGAEENGRGEMFFSFNMESAAAPAGSLWEADVRARSASGDIQVQWIEDHIIGKRVNLLDGNSR